ncbi:MAG: beta-ketoacyl-[acyl-carrier-protein] synthase family protein [Anaerolineae bacterium]
MRDTRVVVTGLGAVTPCGLDMPSTWAALVAGTSGTGPLTAFDPTRYGLAARAAGEVAGFAGPELLGRRRARRMDRVMQFAVVAAREAATDAGLLPRSAVGGNGTTAGGGAEAPGTLHGVAPEGAGAFIGSALGGVTTLIDQQLTLEEKGGRRVSPFTIPMCLVDSVPAMVALDMQLKGPNLAHVSACASGANAIGEAFEVIRRGGADLMLAGGSEAPLAPIIVAAFENMGALSTGDGDPTQASRPFDRRRDGFVIAEGAAVLVLEGFEHAAARGARVYAQVVGYGSTADAVHATAPAEGGEGILRAIDVAMTEAGAKPADIDYVSAHGTSTPLNDAVETVVLKTLLGRRALEVPASSIKSMLGHMLGAGGAVEAAAMAMTVSEGVVPPTINLHDPDPQCDLDYVPLAARRVADGVGLALSTSLGFGGHNAALVFAAI